MTTAERLALSDRLFAIWRNAAKRSRAVARRYRQSAHEFPELRAFMQRHADYADRVLVAALAYQLAD